MLVNVLKKEVVFFEGIRITKVCVAGGDVEPAIIRFAGEKGKPGRKRSTTKDENEQLVKKGKDVERNT